jgi:hypothetical protein
VARAERPSAKDLPIHDEPGARCTHPLFADCGFVRPLRRRGVRAHPAETNLEGGLAVAEKLRLA